MGLNSRSFIIAFLGLLICFLGATPGRAEPLVSPASPLLEAETPKFILVVIDQVTWEDYLDVDAPTLHWLTQESALGLMVARTAGSRSRGGYLTIGAGTRLRASAAVNNIYEPEGFAFSIEERTQLGPADKAYTWLTGKAAGSAEVLHLGLSSLLQDNGGLNYPAQPGQLGEVLHSHGFRVACLGNADLPGKSYRPIAALAMDTNGRVALGEVHRGLLEQNAEGLPRTSVSRLKDTFDKLLPQADFIAIDFGDTSRFARSGKLMTEEIARRHRREALQRADSFLSHVLEKMQDKTWRLLIISPHLLKESGRPASRFSPIIMFGSNVSPGLLTSASTRTPAVVVNTDIAPTILDFFHLPPDAQMLGRPLASTPAPAQPAVLWLNTEEALYEAVETQRAALIRPATIIIVVIFALCGIALLLGKNLSLRLKSWLRGLCLGVLAWPIVMALFGVWLPSNAVLSWVAAVAGCLFFAIIAAKSSTEKLPPFAFLASLIVIILTFVLIQPNTITYPNSLMLRFSPLSYSLADGSRYYGIGNEFGGVLLGAFLFALLWLWQGSSRRKQYLRWLFMVILLGLLGFSMAGANFGMALAAVFACWTIVFLTLPPKSLRRWLWGLALIIIFIGYIYMDLLLKSGGSHIGLAARQPEGEHLLGLIFRKVTMNLRLLKFSLWADVLVAAAGWIILAAVKLGPRFGEMLDIHPGLRPAFYASLAGGGAALLFNDSGILAAALCLVYPAAVTGYLALGNTEKDLPPDLTAAEQ